MRKQMLFWIGAIGIAIAIGATVLPAPASLLLSNEGPLQLTYQQTDHVPNGFESAVLENTKAGAVLHLRWPAHSADEVILYDDRYSGDWTRIAWCPPEDHTRCDVVTIDPETRAMHWKPAHTERGSASVMPTRRDITILMEDAAQSIRRHYF